MNEALFIVKNVEKVESCESDVVSFSHDFLHFLYFQVLHFYQVL